MENLQPLSEASDELLAMGVGQKDVNALAVLYDRYAQVVYAMATHMLGPAEAEEMVQDIFLKLWRKASQFDNSRGSFKAWFMTLARYRLLDELRRRSRREQWTVADNIEHLLANAADPTADVEQAVGRREAGETVIQALNTLPTEQRRVLLLTYFGGLSHTAIAERLDVPLGTVKKRIRLGLKKLRAALVPSVTVSSSQAADET